MTMIDVVVSMAIMSVFLSMFTTGILQIYKGTNKIESITNAQAQLNIIFLRLDKEVRYAAGISVPLDVGPDSYVEYLTTNTGTPVCSELRLYRAKQQVQRRTWTDTASTPVPTGWAPMVSGVTATTPFTRLPPDVDANYQRLQIRVAAVVGAGPTAASKTIDIRFGALNTSMTTDSDTVCTDGRAVP
jgi:hypothetical protein